MLRRKCGQTFPGCFPVSGSSSYSDLLNKTFSTEKCYFKRGKFWLLLPYDDYASEIVFFLPYIMRKNSTGNEQPSKIVQNIARNSAFYGVASAQRARLLLQPIQEAARVYPLQPQTKGFRDDQKI